MSNQTTATWQSAAQPVPVLHLLKDAFAATPLGIVLAAFKSSR
jgi:hypothetical protein